MANRYSIFGDVPVPVANRVPKADGAGDAVWSKNTQILGNYITVGMPGTDTDVNSIAAAIAAAVAGGVSQNNPYQIVVYPGVYFEDNTAGPVVVPDGLVITSSEGTIDGTPILVFAADPNQDLFLITGVATLNALVISGVADPLKACVRIASFFALLSDCSFFGCSNAVVVEAGGIPSTTAFLIGNAFFAPPGAPMGTGVTVDGVGTSLTIGQSIWYVPAAFLPFFPPGVNPIETCLHIKGGSRAELHSPRMRVAHNTATQVGILISDANTKMVLQNCSLTDLRTAIKMDASAANAVAIVQSITFSDCVENFRLDNATALAFGLVEQDSQKDVLVPGAELSGVFQDEAERATDIAGAAAYRFMSTRQASLPDYFFDHTSSGIVSGGAVADAGGLNVNVASGSGWVRRAANSDARKVNWNAVAPLALPDNSTVYIRYNGNTLAIDTTIAVPSAADIVLAVAVTAAGDIRFLHNLSYAEDRLVERLQTYLTDTRLFQLQSGLLASAGTTARRINIASGTYYRAMTPLTPPGLPAADASFSSFYGVNGATETPGVIDIDITNYDNAGALAAMTANFFRTDSLVITSDGRIGVIYGTAEYVTQAAAEAAPREPTPTFMQPTGFPIARLVVQQGNGIVAFIDDRPQGDAGGTGVPTTGVTDHGALSGLADDDHPQYMLANGGRAMSGDLDMGAQDVTNVNLVDGVDVSAHAVRHQPGGADGLPVAVPVAVLVGAAPATGGAASFAASDHQHGVAAGVVPQSVGLANAEGGSAAVARADHVHAHGNQPGGALHALAGGGADGFLSDADKAKLDTVQPDAAAVTDAIAPAAVDADPPIIGAAATAARADHKHSIQIATPVSTGSANAEGVSASLARADHVHQTRIATQSVSATAPVNTNSLADVALAGMSLIPGAGNWLLLFSGQTQNQNQNQGNTFSVYVNGVQVARTERTARAGQANADVNISIAAVIAALAGQVVEIRWRVTGSTGTISNRELILTRAI